MWGGTRTLQSGTGGPPSDPFPDRCSPLNGRIKTRRARPSAHVAHKRDRRHRCWIRWPGASGGRAAVSERRLPGRPELG
jgi:hypothetical protein